MEDPQFTDCLDDANALTPDQLYEIGASEGWKDKLQTTTIILNASRVYSALYSAGCGLAHQDFKRGIVANPSSRRYVVWSPKGPWPMTRRAFSRTRQSMVKATRSLCCTPQRIVFVGEVCCRFVSNGRKRTRKRLQMNPIAWLSLQLTNSVLQPEPSDRLRLLYIHLLRHIILSYDDLSLRAAEEGFMFFNIGSRSTSRTIHREDVAAAFRMLAASKCVVGLQKDEDIDVELLFSGQKIAKRIESSVVRLIDDIGKTVVESERPRSGEKLRDDLTFAYFCEKEILILLVNIAMDVPAPKKKAQRFHWVVWTAKVKAQVLRTISFLVSGVKDKTALYYLLSHHSINRLIMSFLPLSKWNDPALTEMLSPYAELLKTLAVQLGAYPDLFLPLFTLQSSVNNVTSFPLFSAILEIADGTYTKSSSYVHATCLNLVVGLMRISDDHVRTWIISAEQEQAILCEHICRQLKAGFDHIADSTTGPVVDGVRHNGLVAQIAALDDLLDVVSDTFWCKIEPLNTRLCERLLQVFIRKLLLALAPTNERPFLVVAESDWDVVPAMEAHAQAATFLLSRLFLKLDYPPFIRMLAVALFHPTRTTDWSSTETNTTPSSLTASLNSIVLDSATETCPNNFRQEVINALKGKYGDWRLISTTALFGNALVALDHETLTKVCVIPSNLNAECHSFERALSEFLARDHEFKSNLSAIALECGSSVAFEYMRKVQTAPKLATTNPPVEEMPLMQTLESTREYFFTALLSSRNALEVKDTLVRVVEGAVLRRYKNFTLGKTRGFAYSFVQQSATGHRVDAECLVRKLRGTAVNEVIRFRFLADMAVHFRAACRIGRADDWYQESEGEALTSIDNAGELTSIFGGVMASPAVGADLDLRDRTVFPFSAQMYNEEALSQKPSENEQEKTQTLCENMIFRSLTTGLLLVVDPTIMFVVKPFASEANTGTVVCAVPIVDIVAAAADDERLHIAVRHENVGFLIKNGNMLLTFESAGTCLVASQYLDQCRKLLETELYGKIVALFSSDIPDAEPGTILQQSKTL